MNAVYKLIFNVSTGTWAVAHEFAAARGKKSRTRLAAAMAVALSLPAGAALAADSPAALQCGVNEAVSLDGQRCDAASSMAPMSGAIGTNAALDDKYVQINSTQPAASATGLNAIAIGQTTSSTGSSSVAIGSDTTADGEHGIAIGGNAANASGFNGQTAIGGHGAYTEGTGATALGNGARATAASATAIGDQSVADVANTVSVGSTAIKRKIVNMADGTVAAGSSEAVTGSQLYTTNQNVAANAAGIKAVDDYFKASAGTAASVGTNSSVAAGAGAVATALQTTAVGAGANAGANNASAFGRNASAGGEASLAMGSGSSASGYHAAAIGTGSVASGRESVALGTNSTALEDNTVAVGSASLKRRIVNMAAGIADTDAVNVSQLKPIVAGLGGGASIDPTTGVVTGPIYNFGGNGSFNDVGAALGNLDGRVDSLETSGGGAGPGLVERNATTGEITVANKEVGGNVNLRDANGDTRTLTGIKAGTTRTDAVNFGQLSDTAASTAAALGGGATVGADGTVTAPSYSIGGSDYANVGDAFDAVDGSLGDLDTRVGTVEGDVTTIQGDITNLSNGTVGIVKYDATTHDVNVATDKAGETVNFAGTDGERTLAGVKAGVADTDAANFGQLKGTAQSIADGLGGGSMVNPDGTVSAPSYSVGGTTVGNVGDAITNIDGRTTVNEGDISNLTTVVNDLQAGVGGIVSYDAATGTVQVASAQAGDTVDFTGTAGERLLTGVAEGTLSSTSTDAVNGSQLFDTNERVTAAEGDITSIQGDITTVQGDVTNLAGRVGNTADSVAAALGGGSVANADGSISAPSYSVGGTTVDNVGDALGNLDGRVTTNTGDISNLTTVVNDLQAGVGGIVSYDAPTGTVKVASAQAGDTVDFAGTAGDRTLAGVKAGVADKDAANVGQLKGTAQSVADGLGGGSIVNADGTITVPSYSIGGNDYTNVGDAFGGVDTSLTNLDGRVTRTEGDVTNLTSVVNNLSSGAAGIVTYDQATGVVNVAAQQGGAAVDMTGTDGARQVTGVADGVLADGSEDAVNGSQLKATNDQVAANTTNITNLDGRVTRNEGDITNLTTQVTNLSSGAAGLVIQDPSSGNIAVASQLGGEAVNVEGTDGKRRLSGVANGIDDGDAVSMAQLRAAGAIDPISGDVLTVLTYDDSSLAKATLGGSNGTVIGNLGNGLVAAGSREAVNGGQLFQMNADWEAKWSAMDGRVGTIEAGIADGSIGGGSGGAGGGDAGNGLVGPGTGEGSLVVGDGSADGTGSVAVGGGAAGGEGSVAIGGGSSATGDNSVAIGSGSVADRDNEVSMGSAGGERIVSNVAAGVRPTDAVNVQQMNDRFESERRYVDERFHGVDKRIDRMGAISAAYAGMAINTAGLAGDNRVGAGIGSQNGRTALAVGYQRILGEKKNVSVSLGGAFSGSDQSVSAGAGFSW